MLDDPVNLKIVVRGADKAADISTLCSIRITISSSAAGVNTLVKTKAFKEVRSF